MQYAGMLLITRSCVRFSSPAERDSPDSLQPVGAEQFQINHSMHKVSALLHKSWFNRLLLTQQMAAITEHVQQNCKAAACVCIKY